MPVPGSSTARVHLRRGRRAGWLLAAALSTAVGARSAYAQDFPDPNDPAPQDESAAPTKVGHTFRVKNAESSRMSVDRFKHYAAIEEWSLAAEALQSLLDTPPDEGVVVDVPGVEGVRFMGVARYAEQMFHDLPAPGRAAWDELYRDKAEELLDRGVRLRRAGDLAEAARRFPSQDVRRRAYDALGRLATARGDFSQAAHALERLTALATEAELPAVLARLALARAEAGNRAGTERVHDLAAPYLRSLVPGPAGPETLRTFLDRMLAAAGPAADASTGWPQFSGNAQGTRLSADPTRPVTPGWSDPVPTKFLPGRENSSRSSWDTDSARPVQPVIAGNSVYLNSGLDVRSIDLPTGLPSWTFAGPWSLPQWRDNDALVLAPAVTGDRVYAALAERFDAPPTDRRFLRYVIINAMPHRVLFALDRATGDPVWSHEEEHLGDREDAAEIREESVACPPFVIGDDLLVTTWKFDGAYELRLVCFDRHTGATRWRRPIVHGQQELNLFGRPVKELVSSPLAELDGVIYLSTGLGVSAAVDRTSGEVLWISAYPRTPIPRSVQWFETRDRNIDWVPSRVAATRSMIVMAPNDSPRLLGLDPRSGRIVWSQEARAGRRRYRWFAGVAGDRAFVVGDRVLALDVANGAPVWTGEDSGRLSLPHRNEERARGRPVLSADHVYVPTDSNVFVVSTRSGAIEAVWPLPEGAGQEWGDLVSADGTLLLTTTQYVQAFYAFDDLRKRLADRIERNPDDPQLRLEAGEIFRTAGRLDEAIVSLRLGLELSGDLGAAARRRLEQPLRKSLSAALGARALRRLTGEPLSSALDDLRAAVDVAGDPADAAAGLIEVARVATAFGRTAVAEQALERALREQPETLVRLQGDGSAPAGALALLRLGELDEAERRDADAAAHWLDLLETYPNADLGSTNVQTLVRERVGRLLARNDPAATELVSRRSRAALEQARASGDADALTRVARVYPDPAVAAQAALLAADAHLKAHRERDAVLTLRDLLRKELDAETKARALWRLARAYREIRSITNERSVLEQIVREAPDVLLTTETAGELARAELSGERFVVPPATVPDPGIPAVEHWTSDDPTGLSPTVLRITGTEPPALVGNVLVTREQILELRDGGTGDTHWRRALKAQTRLAIGAGPNVVLVGDLATRRTQAATIEAFDAATGEPAWSRTIDGGWRESDSNLGALYVLTSNTPDDGRPSFTLTTIDLRNGDVLADRTFDGHLGPQITAADDAVLVYEYSLGNPDVPPRTVTVLDAATLAVRGRVVLKSPEERQVAVHIAPSPVAVIWDERRQVVVGIDLGTGSELWRRRLEGDPQPLANALLPVKGGAIVTDTRMVVRRLDPATGADVWKRSFENEGDLIHRGVTVDDGIVVVNLQPKGPRDAGVVSVCMDAADGKERWRADLGPLTQAATYVCRNSIVYQVRKPMSRIRSQSIVRVLDRETGHELQEIAPEALAAQQQTLFFSGQRIVIATPSTLSIYGPAAR